jgi:hypothetical protein
MMNSELVDSQRGEMGDGSWELGVRIIDRYLNYQ